MQSFDLESWRLLRSTPEGEGRFLLDAPEGMAVAYGRLYVVDTAQHRVMAFDTVTLERVRQYPPIEWHAASGTWVDASQAHGHGCPTHMLNNPMGIAVFEEELFVADTHNDRIQVGRRAHDPPWAPADHAHAARAPPPSAPAGPVRTTQQLPAERRHGHRCGGGAPRGARTAAH